MSDESVRFDVWLWAVRIFKTRTLAADKCRRGHVKVEKQGVKPSRKVQVGMKLSVKKDGVWREFLVLGLLSKRMSAKIVIDFVRETTPLELLERYRKIRSLPVPRRAKGTGRPTKKERRNLEKVSNPLNQSKEELS